MIKPAGLWVTVVLSAIAASWPIASYGQRATTGGAPTPGPDAQRPGSQGAQEREAEDPAIPPLTDADRAAAFPDVRVGVVHDDAVHALIRVDQLEWQSGEPDRVDWDAKGWIGGDRDRLWFRTEGLAETDQLDAAEAHLFYGRAFARWWDIVVGFRQDVGPHAPQSWLAVGVQGLAPYWFEVEATAYLGADGQTAARFEVEYELLLTNRLVLEPLVELNLYGKTNVERGIGAGLSEFDGGLRLRYELRREFAPYLGVVWRRTFGDTADLANAAGQTTGGRRFVAGLRLWY